MNDELNRNTNGEEEEEKKKKKGIFILFFIIGLALFIWGAVQTGMYFYSQYQAKQAQNEIDNVIATTVAGDDSAVNPIDFKSLQKQNDEIYAWIKIPGTPIDYPLVQSQVDDTFYLTHSALDKSYLSSGAIYTESLNTKTFTDRVTVVYGHNGYTDIMFMPLHDFEKKAFFDSHDTIYVYTPDAKLTYKIVSAFKYDDRHLLNSFDFQDNEVYLDFLNMIQNPSSTTKNVRVIKDKNYTLDDNILVLSTCVWHQDSFRYLVCGVLVKNEKTN